MANVFTKKSKSARTTTLRDFAFGRSSKWQHVTGHHQQECRQPGHERILSPTRRCNPHPPGLVFQSAYNKDNNTFDIWNPNFVKIAKRIPDMLGHLQRSNFCSGPMPPKSLKKGPPEIRYTLTSVSRISYETPRYPSDTNYTPVVTRFGYTPYKPASGIVPNALPSIHKPPE